MDNLNLLMKLLTYKFFESYDKPPYPINLTLSITNKCNSKCKTCKIWQQKKKDMPLGVWRKILESIGDAPYFVTISGGEPFLNKDLVKIVSYISKYNKPRILNIASNGILTKEIVDKTKKITKLYNGDLTINLSLDGEKNTHNKLRGVDCFDKVTETFRLLREIKGVSVGLHSVISKYNPKRFIDFYNFVKSELKPSQHIIEIAENRTELNNLKDEIIPKKKDYLKIIKHLQSENNLMTRKFIRKKYYYLTKDIFNNKKSIKCYAGIASAHIASDGELWACCMRCESLGNLRKKSFREVWLGKKATEIRQNIAKRNCTCMLANANFTNLLLNWKRLCTL